MRVLTCILFAAFLASVDVHATDPEVPLPLELEWLKSQIKLLRYEVNVCVHSGGKALPIPAGRFRRQPADDEHVLKVDIKLAKDTVAFFRERLIQCHRSLSQQKAKTTFKIATTSGTTTTMPTTKSTTAVMTTATSTTTSTTASTIIPTTTEKPFHFNATFTTLGASGRLGPTQLRYYYKGQDHDGMVTVDKGIQIFTVPKTGKYIIRVAGGVGGCDNYYKGCYPGYGAYMQGTFALKQGVKLKILVGQRAPNNFIIAGTGGGGGSFVTLTDNTPLLIAGGGGGRNSENARRQECDGTTARNGTSGYNPNGGAWPGGKDGNGATTADSGYSGGGGGGLLTDGRSSINFGGSYGQGGEGGKAFVNGGIGGRALFNNAVGGFGGGGGAYGAGGGGGGGGGYSGGASGDGVVDSCGGGGGSYNDGEDQDNRGGFNNGDGYVIMTYE